MGLLSKVGDRLTLVAMRVLLREVRALRQTLEIGIDSYRAINGIPPYFNQPAPVDGPMTDAEVIRGSIIRPGDYQTLWLIEELCREHNVPLTAESDLEQIAVDRGWVGPDGTMLMTPKAAEGLEVDR